MQEKIRSGELQVAATAICMDARNKVVLDFLVLRHREALMDMENAALENLDRAQGRVRGLSEILGSFGVREPLDHLVTSMGK